MACTPDLLHAVQQLQLYSDCKEFVDKPVQTSLEELLEDWRALQLTSNCSDAEHKQRLQALVFKHFGEAGSDLEAVAPVDWQGGVPPRWMLKLGDCMLLAFATGVHQLWCSLSRKARPDVAGRPHLHTLLPLPHPFIIPGDRFRECYYWDSYWILRGLLASDLVVSARNLVLNLLSTVDRLGFIPNGVRSYYTNRSQPPLISAMVRAVLEHQDWQPGGTTSQDGRCIRQCLGVQQITGCSSTSQHGHLQQQHQRLMDDANQQLLQYALPRLLRTHVYWAVHPKQVPVVADCPARASASALDAAAANTATTRAGGAADAAVAAEASTSTSHDEGGRWHSSSSGGAATGEVAASAQVHMLARYHADWRQPRPESYREDMALAAGLPKEAAEQLYCDIASAAESGWDFSSRWCSDGANLATIRTTQVVPADLNAFLFKLEQDIAILATRAGDTLTASTFAGHAAARLSAINQLMWDEAGGCWRDLLLLPATQPATAVIVRTAAAPTVSAASLQPSTLMGAASKQAAGTAAPCWQEPLAAQSDVSPAAAPAAPPSSVPHSVRQLPGTLASNWVPLWAGCAEAGGRQAAAAVAGLQRSGLIQPAGILTSLQHTGQQWDAPNAWPPLQHMLVEGAAQYGGAPGAALAAHLAFTWIRTNLLAWQASGVMHEKYNGYDGGAGGGGEYAPQVGFGWTNGVLLDFLKTYGQDFPSQVCCEQCCSATDLQEA